jgi:hypothetical protein
VDLGLIKPGQRLRPGEANRILRNTFNVDSNYEATKAALLALSGPGKMFDVEVESYDPGPQLYSFTLRPQQPPPMSDTEFESKALSLFSKGFSSLDVSQKLGTALAKVESLCRTYLEATQNTPVSKYAGRDILRRAGFEIESEQSINDALEKLVEFYQSMNVGDLRCSDCDNAIDPRSSEFWHWARAHIWSAPSHSDLGRECPE